MSRRHDLQSADGAQLSKSPEGKCFVSARGAPTNGQAGFAPACVYQDVAAGAAYLNTGTSLSSTWALLGTATGTFVAGLVSGYKLARGTIALDGANPTPVTTGLATVVSATASLQLATAPGLGTSLVTVDASGYATGTLNLFAWMPTSVSNPTLIASPGTETVQWVALGT